MTDHTKTSPEKLAEMNASLIVDNNYLRERLREFKVAAYRRGLYSIPVPPVCTTAWGEGAWINYIDSYGVWMQ